jgi:hypothetical protein
MKAAWYYFFAMCFSLLGVLAAYFNREIGKDYSFLVAMSLALSAISGLQGQLASLNRMVSDAIKGTKLVEVRVKEDGK